jgi:hypothetical protein
MTRPRHIFPVLVALLMILGGMHAAMGVSYAPAHDVMATGGTPCDHCLDQTAPSDRLCAMACAMTAAIVPDAPIDAVRAKQRIVAPRPEPAIDRDSRPDPYPPRPTV